jgi:hypothetical protein
MASNLSTRCGAVAKAAGAEASRTAVIRGRNCVSIAFGR